jgi:hypothetical protein
MCTSDLTKIKNTIVVLQHCTGEDGIVVLQHCTGEDGISPPRLSGTNTSSMLKGNILLSLNRAAPTYFENGRLTEGPHTR